VAKHTISREEKIELYERLVAGHSEAVLKGATMPYTSVNGHMYSYMAKDDSVGLRLPETERLEFIARYKSKLMEQYGIIQKEYVVVPDSLLKKTKELELYFDVSYRYVSSLKPKATTKGKKKP
jgi:hypothetical protein